MTVGISGVTLSIILSIFVLVTFAILNVGREKKRAKILELRAKNRHGEYFKNSQWELELPFQNDTVFIQRSFGGKYDPARTFAVYRPDNGIATEFEVCRSTLSCTFATAFDKERILLENEFDKHFFFHGAF